MAFATLLSALVLILNTGGLLGAEVRSSIIGGQDAQKGSWPSMVHLNLTSDGVNKWRCGATIVSDDWLMTSASCVKRNPEPDWRRSMAWVNVHALRTDRAKYMDLTTALPHPDYQANNYAHDIALIKLKKKVDFKKMGAKVNLPSAADNFSPSSECWITGWGNVGIGVPLPYPETLQQLKIPILPSDVCDAKYPDLAADTLCAGDMAGGKDACPGDYGGPLMCRAKSGFVQVGIMSHGNCGLPDKPGVYTQVSKHLDFINDYVHREEASAEE
ncbi:tryptase-2 [Etheostoma spectabile]|uniref:tryptase-2 n=1 Tax=Etheostoma spectabile TaxID=54343 RepID=UPI0013AF731E|nr:tryptase-2-like [Etheostoma spectabile]